MGILDPRLAVKPFEYDWAIRYWRDVHSSHWLPEEISMTEDVQDFHTKLTAAERWVSGGTLKGFTQTEVLIGDFWTKICHWIPKPEIIMMAMSFAAWESIHIMAYSIMNDSLGLNDYEAFLQDPMCKAKLERLMGAGLDSRSRTQGKLIASLQELRGRLLSGSFDGDRDAAVVSQTLEHLSIPAADQAATPEEIARAIAIFSAFGEGVSLFSSFAVLLNFTRMPRNCLKGMGKQISYSVRDESLHSEAGCRIFNTIVADYPDVLSARLKDDVREAAHITVKLESDFIERLFVDGPVADLRPDDLKAFIRHRTDTKLGDIGFAPEFKGSYTTEQLTRMEWFDYLTGGRGLQDFFDQQPTEYASKMTTDWNSIW